MIIKNVKEDSEYEKVELLILNLKLFLKREMLSLGEKEELRFIRSALCIILLICSQT